MKKIASFTVKFRIIILAAVLVFAGVCGFLMTKVNINKDMTAYLADSSNMKQGIDIMAEEFSDLSQANTLRLMINDLAEEDKAEIKAYLEKIEYVASVSYEAENEDYNKDNHTLYIITTDYSFGSEEEKSIENAINEKCASYEYLLEQQNDTASGLTAGLIAGAMAILLVILFAMSGSWFEPLIYLAVIGIAVLINMGTNVFKSSVSETTFSIAAILQLVLSIDYSIILMNRYKQELKSSENKYEAMKNAITNAFSSVASSALTTIVGLLMLLFMSFKIGADLGIVLAKGVACSLLCVFTVLPALILIFNNAIAKTEKRILKIPTGALAKFSIKARVPLTIIFVGLFVAAYFFQTKTDISFSMNTTNGIKDYFTADNTTVVLFANEDSGNIGKIADEISKDENVRSVISYPTLIGKESTAEELTEDISALTDDFKIETRMLKFIYYKYHNEDNLPSLRAADLINFISEDIAEDEMFSQYIDDSLKDNVSMLGKFSDKNTLTREMTAEELGEFFGMDGEELKQLFVLYYADKDVSVSNITMPRFVKFLQDDILTNETYSAMIDKDMASQTDKLALFTDKDLITTPKTSAEMAELTGTDESSLRLAYIMYNGLLRSGEGISPYDLMTYMVSNETVSGQLDETTYSQLQTLVKIMDKTISGDRCDYRELSGITGMDLTYAKQMMLLYTSKYGDTSSWKMSPRTFVKFVISDVMTNPDYSSAIGEEYSEYLTSADVLIDAVVSDKEFSAREITSLLGGLSDEVDESTINLLLTYYASINDYDESYTLSIEKLFGYINENFITDPLLGNMLDDEIKQQISGMGDMLETAVNSLKRENHSLLQITSKYPDESDETMSFMAQLNRLCDENLTEDHYIIGSSEMYYEMSQTFRREMLIMTLLTAISIFIIVLLSFRNGLIPLILVLIVQCGVFITAAVSYLRGYSVNYLAYLIVQCILMGATIDYGILFTNYYREYRKAESRDESLKSAYAGSVHTILTSGLIMIGVTGVIGFTSPDPTIGPICQTISVGCLSAVLLILFVLPGMLAASDRLIVKRKKPAEEDKKES